MLNQWWKLGPLESRGKWVGLHSVMPSNSTICSPSHMWEGLHSKYSYVESEIGEVTAGLKWTLGFLRFSSEFCLNFKTPISYWPCVTWQVDTYTKEWCIGHVQDQKFTHHGYSGHYKDGDHLQKWKIGHENFWLVLFLKVSHVSYAFKNHKTRSFEYKIL